MSVVFTFFFFFFAFDWDAVFAYNPFSLEFSGLFELVLFEWTL